MLLVNEFISWVGMGLSDPICPYLCPNQTSQLGGCVNVSWRSVWECQEGGQECIFFPSNVEEGL